MRWDVFISHASEDKDAVARPLAEELKRLGLSVWYDEQSLRIGDSLRRSIDEGLARSRYAAVVLSTRYLEKEWTRGELDALFARQRKGRIVILPILHGISHDEVLRSSPMVADLLAADTTMGIPNAAKKILEAISRDSQISVEVLDSDRSRRTTSSLRLYLKSLENEILNNLVLELYEKDVYEDLCIAPLVSQSLGRGTLSPPREVGRCIHFMRACIVGEPGSGKTTALRKLSLEFISQDSPSFIPVFVSLAAYSRQFLEEGFKDFMEFLDEGLSLHGAPGLSTLTSASQPPLLLLDGWDEIMHEKARYEIKRFLSSANIRCILTSRPEAQRSLPRCERFEMQPLTPHRMREFIRLRLKNPETVESVLHWILASPTMTAMARNPLNLSLMTIVSIEEGELGGLKKTSLYERAFEVILRQYYRGATDESSLSVSPQKIRSIEKILQRLAYEMLKSGHGRFFSERDLYTAANGMWEDDGENLAHLLSGRLGIVRDRRSGRYEFFHLWYQELLAARQVLETPGDITTELDSGNLTGILPFIVGLQKNPNEAAEALFKVPISDPFTYCRAIAEAELSKENQIKILTRLLDFGASQAPPVPTRVEMSRALVEAGEHIIGALYAIAESEDQSDYARRASLEALVDLEPDSELVDSLLTRLLNTASTGLLWHVVEHVGNRRIEHCRSRLKEFCSSKDAILAGDALWALQCLDDSTMSDAPSELAQRLISLLKSADEHIKGHALRTVGRLRIASATPVLEEFFQSTKAPYRWIVPEAAGLIGSRHAIELLSECLDDSDPRVVGSSIQAISRLERHPSQSIVEKLLRLSERTEWIPHLDQTLGRSAQSVLEQLDDKEISKKHAVIYVARHCKTEWNMIRRLQGSVDLPLSFEGQREASSVAPGLVSLNIDRIITSSAKRAQETAEIYASYLDVPLSIFKGLREFDHGHWEGSTWEELLQKEESLFRSWMKNPEGVQVPGSKESASSAQQRIIEAIRTIARSHRGEKLLVISHKHILAMLKCAVEQVPLSSFASMIDDDVAPQRLSEVGLKQLCEE